MSDVPYRDTSGTLESLALLEIRPNGIRLGRVRTPGAPCPTGSVRCWSKRYWHRTGDENSARLTGVGGNRRALPRRMNVQRPNLAVDRALDEPGRRSGDDHRCDARLQSNEIAGEVSRPKLGAGETCLLPARHPAFRRRESDIRLVHGTWEPVVSMLREKSKWSPRKDQSLKNTFTLLRRQLTGNPRPIFPR